MPSSVFSISLPLFFGANIPSRRLPSASSSSDARASISDFSINPRSCDMTDPAILPSIMAELASSIPDTSPAANIPGTEVLPHSSHSGTYPPGVSFIFTPACFKSCDIGESPTATHIVSTSNVFSVPSMKLKWLSTCAIVTPVTLSVPLASTIVCDK